MKFIIWDPNDGVNGWGPPRTDDGGNIISDGLIGRVTEGNCYLTAYPKWPKGAKPVTELAVGACIKGVEYRLSGSSGVYDVYRVE